MFLFVYTKTTNASANQLGKPSIIAEKNPVTYISVK